MNLQRHKVSYFFGDMTQEEHDGLRESVNERGFINPVIYTLEGEIADGWHRYKVAVEFNRVSELEFVELDSIEQILDLNHHRRHKDSSVRAVSIVCLSEWAERGYNQHVNSVYTLATASEMAEKANVSRQYIQLAKRAVREGREDEVIREGKSLSSLFQKDKPTSEYDEFELPEEGYVKIEIQIIGETFIAVCRRQMKHQHVQDFIHNGLCPMGDSQYLIIRTLDHTGTREFVKCSTCAAGAGFCGNLAHAINSIKVIEDYEKAVNNGKGEIYFDIYNPLKEYTDGIMKNIGLQTREEAINFLEVAMVNQYENAIAKITWE